MPRASQTPDATGSSTTAPIPRPNLLRAAGLTCAPVANLRQDRLRLSNDQLIATLEAGRRLVIDALAIAPTKRRMQRWLETNPFERGG